MVFGAGNYPAEFNPKIHGPYSPARFYGKPDTPLSQVKLGELGSWLSRRSFHPASMSSAVSRVYWRWAKNWLLVKKPGAAPIIHVAMLTSAFFYCTTYGFIKYHKHAKYH